VQSDQPVLMVQEWENLHVDTHSFHRPEIEREIKMFKCQNKGCHRLVPRYQPVNRVVLETRSKNYVNHIKKGRNEMTVETSGEEIVREIDVCPECYTNITGEQPARSAQPAPPVQKHRPQRKMRDDRGTWRNPRRGRGPEKEKEVKRKPVVEKVNQLQRPRNDQQGN